MWLAAAGPRAVTITGGGIQEATVVFRRVCTTVVMLWYCKGVVAPIVYEEGVVILAVVVVVVILAVVEVLWEPDLSKYDGLLVAPAGLAATGLGDGRRVTEPVGK
jgi:hypothetical protein